MRGGRKAARQLLVVRLNVADLPNDGRPKDGLRAVRVERLVVAAQCVLERRPVVAQRVQALRAAIRLDGGARRLEQIVDLGAGIAERFVTLGGAEPGERRVLGQDGVGEAARQLGELVGDVGDVGREASGAAGAEKLGLYRRCEKCA